MGSTDSALLQQFVSDCRSAATTDAGVVDIARLLEELLADPAAVVEAASPLPLDAARGRTRRGPVRGGRADRDDRQHHAGHRPTTARPSYGRHHRGIRRSCGGSRVSDSDLRSASSSERTIPPPGSPRASHRGPHNSAARTSPEVAQPHKSKVFDGGLPKVSTLSRNDTSSG